MIKPVLAILAILATCGSLMLAACDAGRYDPAAHRQASDPSTGSMLSGADAGANTNGGVGDISMRSNTGAGSPGGH